MVVKALDLLLGDLRLGRGVSPPITYHLRRRPSARREFFVMSPGQLHEKVSPRSLRRDEAWERLKWLRIPEARPEAPWSTSELRSARPKLSRASQREVPPSWAVKSLVLDRNTETIQQNDLESLASRVVNLKNIVETRKAKDTQRKSRGKSESSTPVSLASSGRSTGRAANQKGKTAKQIYVSPTHQARQRTRKQNCEADFCVTSFIGLGNKPEKQDRDADFCVTSFIGPGRKPGRQNCEAGFAVANHKSKTAKQISVSPASSDQAASQKSKTAKQISVTSFIGAGSKPQREKWKADSRCSSDDGRRV